MQRNVAEGQQVMRSTRRKKRRREGRWLRGKWRRETGRRSKKKEMLE